MSFFSFLGVEGVIKANLTVYFDSLKQDSDHEKAMTLMLKTRYPLDASKRREVGLRWNGTRRAEEEFNKEASRDFIELHKAEVKDLIYVMYQTETHLDKADVNKRIKENQKFDEIFEKLYDPMEASYLEAVFRS